jgi:transposase InsO family protein
MAARLAVDAVAQALARGGPLPGCVTHSDRGSPFRCRDYQESLSWFGLGQSIRRVGLVADNAATESFFALLKKIVSNQATWVTRKHGPLASVSWMEATYHRCGR